MLTSTMKSLINSLWDKFWSGGISNPLTAIEQISYLLFMRRLDQMDAESKSNSEFSGDKYTPIFEGKFKLPNADETVDKAKLRWSYFKQMEGGEMLKHVQIKVFPFIKQVNGRNTVFTKHMEDAVFIIPKASLLVEAVNIIDRLYEEIEKQMKDQSFNDTQGDMYEFLLSEIAQAGKNGQFRTPRHIIQLMCELVDPRLPEIICDPACGTGGFLLGTYQHILTQYTSKENLKRDENGFIRGTVGDKLTDDRLWTQLKDKTLFGYDFDTTMVRIGLMNLILHGIPYPNIERRDTLSKKYNDDNKYNCILANPPFKGSIDKGDINESLSLMTTKTELLFVERIVKSLRTGGRAAVIVPEGVLSNPSKAHKDLRRMLIEKCELQGVISMPSGVFKPYAGVSTAILIFVKEGETDKVWFYDMQADGYSLDDKRERIENNDLQDIIKEWKARHKNNNKNRKAKHFFLSLKEIVENGYDLSMNRYKEIDYDIEKYEKPEIILKKVDDVEKEIQEGIKELKLLLK